MAVTRGRPIDRRGVDPSRRGGDPARGAPDAGGILSVAADRDRAAASRSRRSDRAHDRGCRPARRRCVRARNCRPRPPISMSPTPWANSDCSIGWRRSCSWAARWFRMAGRIRSRRSSSARRSCTARTSSISPTSTRRSIAPAARDRPTRQEALVKQLGQLLADPAAREVSVDGRRARGRATRRRARPHAGRARAVSVAVAARDGSGQCVSRPSGTGPRHGYRDC